MDHAEAHERISDLALDRDALARLSSAGSGEWPGDGVIDDAPLLAHLRGCPTCRADLAAIRVLDARLRDALGDVRDAAAVQPIHAPDALREAVLEAARREPRLSPLGGRPGPASTGRIRRWRLGLPRLTGGQWAAGLAAALVIAFLGGLGGRALAPGSFGPDPSMVAAVATLDRVLAAPDHHLVTLTTPAGAASGSVAWSSRDFVVLTSALSAPEPGRVYRCWLEWTGKSAPVGVMDFAGATAYWTGSAGAWATLLADPGTRFVVTAEAVGPGGSAPTGPVVLQASLGS